MAIFKTEQFLPFGFILEDKNFHILICFLANKSLSVVQVKDLFSNFSIDLDDDIFLYTYSNISTDFKNLPTSIGMKLTKDLIIHPFFTQDFHLSGMGDSLPEISSLKIQMWELYKIHSSYPVSLLRYANFSMNAYTNDDIVDGEKWQRRRDLQVCINCQINYINLYLKCEQLFGLI